MTTAALAVPIVYLRRQRATAGRDLSTAPPPRRSLTDSSPVYRFRPAAHSVPPPRRPSSKFLSAPPPRTPLTSSPAPAARVPTATASSPVKDEFNGAVYCAKAFGMATLYVSVGAGLTVWGVQHFLGVTTVSLSARALHALTENDLSISQAKEFGERMRVLIMRFIPMLTERLHRPPEAEDGGPVVELAAAPHINISDTGETVEWTWPDAERRLKLAFEKDGISGWAQAVLEELEAERVAEKSKRDRI